MIYLASPYTGNEEENYQQALRATAALLRLRYVIYSPIVHCHELAKCHDLPGDIDFWHWYNEEMLVLAKELWILMLPGWATSKGVRHEYNFVKQPEYDLPVSLVDPFNVGNIYPNFLGFSTNVPS